MASTTIHASAIPSITLLCMEDRFIQAFKSAAQFYHLPASVDISFEDCRLSNLPATARFDAIVSPANSYGRLDGGFDHALSMAFSPRDDYHALTRVAQATLYREWRGFAPPGTCTLVDLNDDSLQRNPWDCRYLALCPTMKVPSNVTWDREVVYECVWSLLASLDKHNRTVRAGAGGSDREIRSVLMTPLATGCGRWDPDDWAAQTVLAIKQFADALARPDEWSAMGWKDIEKVSDEVEEAHPANVTND